MRRFVGEQQKQIHLLEEQLRLLRQQRYGKSSKKNDAQGELFIAKGSLTRKAVDYTFFKSLKSARHTSMLEALERQRHSLHCTTLAPQGIDYLRQLPERDEYTVEAADGHFIEHACHMAKGTQGKVYAAGFIYSLNLRYGLLKPLRTEKSNAPDGNDIQSDAHC